MSKNILKTFLLLIFLSLICQPAFCDNWGDVFNSMANGIEKGREQRRQQEEEQINALMALQEHQTMQAQEEAARQEAAFYQEQRQQLEWQREKAQYQRALQEAGEKYERDFLKRHPDVKPGSKEYSAISDLIGQGHDGDEAYEIVFNKRG